MSRNKAIKSIFRTDVKGQSCLCVWNFVAEAAEGIDRFIGRGLLIRKVSPTNYSLQVRPCKGRKETFQLLQIGNFISP